MSVLTVKRSKKLSPAEAMFLLENGATMDQPTFHELYKLTPEGFKAELIGGTVFVASPVSGFHAAPHAKLVAWMILYMDATPGVDVYDNATNILENAGEPQPDAALVLSPEVGGRTRMDDEGYIHGAPELVAEVAHSSASIDLGEKLALYEEAGAREYLVVLVREKKLRWFVRSRKDFVEQEPDDQGVLKSVAFPGLWLSAPRFFRPVVRHWIQLLNQGLASPEHAAFVAELKARRAKHRKRKGK